MKMWKKQLVVITFWQFFCHTLSNPTILEFHLNNVSNHLTNI